MIPFRVDAIKNDLTVILKTFVFYANRIRPEIAGSPKRAVDNRNKISSSVRATWNCIRARHAMPRNRRIVMNANAPRDGGAV